MQVDMSNEEQKYKIFEKGLRIICMFNAELGLQDDGSMSDTLPRAQSDINYEKKLLAKDVEKI